MSGLIELIITAAKRIISMQELAYLSTRDTSYSSNEIYSRLSSHVPGLWKNVQKRVQRRRSGEIIPVVSSRDFTNQQKRKISRSFCYHTAAQRQRNRSEVKKREVIDNPEWC